MANIVWLASYPKSGNTWMRILLTNYIRNEAEPANINRLENISIASDRHLFDEWVGVEASALDNSTVERLRPSVYRCIAREAPENIYMKVHDSWCQTDRGEGLFPTSVTSGVVYIIRNPLDMAASCAHHWGVSMDQAVENLCDPFFTQARTMDEMPDQLLQKIGSWGGHVISWLDDSDLPIHLVRYEDLHCDTVKVFSDIVRFCNLPCDTDRIKKAVTFSEFSELQRQEQFNDFRERSFKTSKPFFRRGQIGSWKEELPEHLVQRLIEIHGETMRRFGYLNDDFEPVNVENLHIDANTNLS